jgi:hypothetical protein
MTADHRRQTAKESEPENWRDGETDKISNRTRRTIELQSHRTSELQEK